MIKLWKNRKIENDILGINERNLNLVYKHNPKSYFPLADDKIKSKQVLHEAGISCAETYAVIRRIGDIHKCWLTTSHHQKLAIKPANGAGGNGIMIIKKDGLGNWFSNNQKITEHEIFAHMSRIIMGMFSMSSSDCVLIEQCIIAHPFFSKMYKGGVPDFRVILIKDRPIMSMLRMPTSKSKGKANLHQGGLGIGIDTDSGTLMEAYDGKLYHKVHPDNGNRIYGRKIPYWDELVSLAVQTSMAFPLDYLGVDIVIDIDHGPLVMEINVRPGLAIQMVNKKGLKSILSTLK